MFKKFLLLAMMLTASLVFFAGCEDPSSSSTRSASLAPPIWIQGNWDYTISIMGYTATMTWTFTTSNVILDDGSDVIDFGAAHTSGSVTVDETVNSDTQYAFTVDDGSGTTETYSFTKTSDTTISYGGLLTYTKR